MILSHKSKNSCDERDFILLNDRKIDNEWFGSERRGCAISDSELEPKEKKEKKRKDVKYKSLRNIVDKECSKEKEKTYDPEKLNLLAGGT